MSAKKTIGPTDRNSALWKNLLAISLLFLAAQANSDLLLVENERALCTIVIAEEPAEKVKRLVPLNFALRQIDSGGFEKVQIIDPENGVIMFEKSGTFTPRELLARS